MWGLLALVLLLFVDLKTGSPDRDAYKNLVFGEGGLVELSQLIVLATRAPCCCWCEKTVGCFCFQRALDPGSPSRPTHHRSFVDARVLRLGRAGQWVDST